MKSSKADINSSKLDIKTVVFDESYRQAEWYGSPTLELGYRLVAEEFSGSFNVTSNTNGYTFLNNFPPNSILVFPIPFGTMVNETEYEQIARWVYDGGRLLVLGFYLMEKHLYGNFNQLLRRFGLEFDQNLTMPVGKEGYKDCMAQAFSSAERDLWISTQPSSIPVDHPIIEGVTTLAITSSCTISHATNAEFIVLTSEPVSVVQGRGYANSSGRLLQIRDYVLDKQTQIPFMSGVSYGDGKIVGIGSWKVFLNDLVSACPDGNGKLFLNIMNWLA